MEAMTFGKKLKIKRAEKGINQEELAEISGISVSQIRRYESPKELDVKPNYQTIIMLANALDIDEKELARLAGYKNIASCNIPAFVNIVPEERENKSITLSETEQLAEKLAEKINSKKDARKALIKEVLKEMIEETLEKTLNKILKESIDKAEQVLNMADGEGISEEFLRKLRNKDS